MSCKNFSLPQGEYLTLEGVAKDQDGDLVDISVGYTFAAAIKVNKSDDDADALVYIDSTNDSTRFSLEDANTVRMYLLLSAECNNADLGRYFYDIWAVETSTGAETPIHSGQIVIGDAVTDDKA